MFSGVRSFWDLYFIQNEQLWVFENKKKMRKFNPYQGCIMINLYTAGFTGGYSNSVPSGQFSKYNPFRRDFNLSLISIVKQNCHQTPSNIKYLLV